MLYWTSVGICSEIISYTWIARNPKNIAQNSATSGTDVCGTDSALRKIELKLGGTEEEEVQGIW